MVSCSQYEFFLLGVRTYSCIDESVSLLAGALEVASELKLDIDDIQDFINECSKLLLRSFPGSLDFSTPTSTHQSLLQIGLAVCELVSIQPAQAP